MMKKLKLLAVALSLVFLALFSFSACNSNDIIDIDGFRSLNGVKMTTEENKYQTGTTEISVKWVNNTKKSLTFGESYYLAKKIDSGWEKVSMLPNIAFISIGYIIMPYSQANHTYCLNYVYKESNLKAGVYRIIIRFFNNADIPITSDDAYWLYSEFEFVN